MGMHTSRSMRGSTPSLALAATNTQPLGVQASC
jgi:hypothetical protein